MQKLIMNKFRKDEKEIIVRTENVKFKIHLIFSVTDFSIIMFEKGSGCPKTLYKIFRDFEKVFENLNSSKKKKITKVQNVETEKVRQKNKIFLFIFLNQIL